HPVLTSGDAGGAPGPSPRGNAPGAEYDRRGGGGLDSGAPPRPAPRTPRAGDAMNSDVRPEPQTIPFDPTARTLGVVVGYDGSENSESAVRAAADVAARRGCSLTVVSAYRAPIPMYANPAALQAWTRDRAQSKEAEELVERASGLLTEHPG